MTTSRHDLPPFVLTPATRPREPPSDQRSCCHVATMLSGCIGFTSTHGSTSVLAKFLPVCPESAVHEAKGLAPETCFGVDAVNTPAQATPAASTATASNPARITSLLVLIRAPPRLLHGHPSGDPDRPSLGTVRPATPRTRTG